MQLASHFTILVYPFVHSLTGSERAARLGEPKLLSKRWYPGWRRLDHKQLKVALDDTYFFLPYIRRTFFPETACLPVDDIAKQVGTAQELAGLSASQLVERLGRDGRDAVLHLTYDPEWVDALHPLQFGLERTEQGKVVESFQARVRLEWIDLFLFPQSVGFLAIKARMEDQEAAVPIDKLVDFLDYLHLIHPPTIDWQLATWQSEYQQDRVTFTTRDLVDYLLQGLSEEEAQSKNSDKGQTRPKMYTTLKAFVEDQRLHGSVPRYSVTEEGQVYGNVFHQLTYACLDGSLAGAMCRSPFTSAVQQAVYELATGKLVTERDYEPHKDGLARILKTGYMALWANWEGMALHDRVVFLGKYPDGFPFKALPHNVESDYFQLYMLTLYQKVRLSMMTGEMMRKDMDLRRNLDKARSLWDSLMMFRNRYWFPEVALKPQGDELYHRFRQGLGVQALYDHVRQEMRVLEEYYERKGERRIENLLNILAFFIVPAEILVHFFGHALVEHATWLDLAEWSVFAYVVAVLAWWAWGRWGRE